MPRRYKIFLWVASITFAVDQISKILARHWLEFSQTHGGKPVAVISDFFEWRLSYNTGSAFGLFRSLGGARVWLSLVGIAAVIAIIWMLRQARDDQKRFTWALGLVAGGAIGNVLDRLVFGKVTDFIVWKWYEREWPTFNIADAALCIGVGLLFLDIGRDARASKDADDEEDEGEAPEPARPKNKAKKKRKAGATAKK